MISFRMPRIPLRGESRDAIAVFACTIGLVAHGIRLFGLISRLKGKNLSRPARATFDMYRRKYDRLKT